MFFFEKRNRKTVIPCRVRVLTRATTSQKFFAAVFQKRRTFLLPLFVCACTSADPTYYTLQVVDGARLPGGPPSVEVRRPGLAGYLDRADIVLKSASYRLDVNSQARWAEPLGDMIGRVLAEDLAQRLPNSSVFTQSGAITADPAVRVEVDILRFDADASGQVELVAELAVERGSSHQPIETRHVALSATATVPGAEGLAGALSGLLGQLADLAAADSGK
jgi:uncharacterized lipoprotein YmbA